MPGSVIDLSGAANCRDIGGWPIASGGTVRRGVLYRSTALNGLTDDGVDELTSLGLRTIYDLRSTAERDAKPDRLPAGLNEVHLDVLADDPNNAAGNAVDFAAIFADPAALEAGLAGTSLASHLTNAYRGVVGLPSALASYRAMFTAIASGDDEPALFHCTTGKDRTGWGTAALLTFLGVAPDEVMAEYLLTNDQILPFTEPYYAMFEAAGGDREFLAPMLGVDEAYLATAFDEMAARFGTIDGYFRDGLGLDAATLTDLRSRLIDPA